MRRMICKGRISWSAIWIVSVLVGLVPSTLDAKEGFGLKKSTVLLDRVRPADVYISGTRIDVRSGTSNGDGSLDVQLVETLKSTVLGNEARFSLDERIPDTLIEVSLVDNDYQERWETRTVKRSYPVGKDSKGRQQYAVRDARVKFKVVSQVFSVSFKVTNMKTRSVLMADTVSRSWNDDYEEGRNAPDRSQLEHRSVSETVDEIARRLTPTVEKIGVLLPGGRLKDLRNLASGGLWNPFLEALDSLSESAKPKDESYRQYSLGVAYEALAYQAEQPEVSIRYLEESASHYQKAIRLNPGEKYFTGDFKGNAFMAGLKRTVADSLGKGGTVERKRAMAPIERVKSALEQYQKVIEFRDADSRAGVRVADALVGAKGASGQKGLAPSNALTNSEVIEMSRAGLDEEIIFSAIDSAEITAFDITPSGLVELARAEVSSKVIQRIQAQATKKD